MTDQLTSAGLELDTFEERLDDVIADLRADISAHLDLSAYLPEGQLVRIPLEKLQQVVELLEVIHDAFDPDNATGVSLEALCALTGTLRREATYGTVTLTVNLDGGTTLLAGSVAGVGSSETNRWATDDDVVAPAGPAANYSVSATCQTAGEVVAPAATITTIVTPVAGWNSVNNALDADPGSDEETEAALRLRREQEVTIGGSASVDSVRAEVSQVDGVQEVIVLENDQPLAVSPMPPSSLEVIYWDGGSGAAATADIAEAIFESKPAGIQAYGSTTVAHADDQGNDHTIGMTLAAEQRILVDITVIQDASGPTVTVAAVRSAITTWADSALTIGQDVYLSKVAAAAAGVDGVEDVPAATVLIAINPAAPANVDVSISARQIATISSGDITVTVV